MSRRVFHLFSPSLKAIYEFVYNNLQKREIIVCWLPLQRLLSELCGGVDEMVGGFGDSEAAVNADGCLCFSILRM